MHHYEGPGELALAAAPACRLIATRLGPGDNLVVERRCLVAASPGVTVDVAFSRALRRRDAAGRVVLMRLTGVGVAFLQAADSSTELELEPGRRAGGARRRRWCVSMRRPNTSSVSHGSAGVSTADREWSGWQRLTGPGRVRLQAASPPPA